MSLHIRVLFQETDIVCTLYTDGSYSVSLCILKVPLFFHQRQFPHQAALPSLEAIRQLFKKHSNKVGSFTGSSLK